MGPIKLERPGVQAFGFPRALASAAKGATDVGLAEQVIHSMHVSCEKTNGPDFSRLPCSFGVIAL